MKIKDVAWKEIGQHDSNESLYKRQSTILQDFFWCHFKTNTVKKFNANCQYNFTSFFSVTSKQIP